MVRRTAPRSVPSHCLAATVAREQRVGTGDGGRGHNPVFNNRASDEATTARPTRGPAFLGLLLVASTFAKCALLMLLSAGAHATDWIQPPDWEIDVDVRLVNSDARASLINGGLG